VAINVIKTQKIASFQLLIRLCLGSAVGAKRFRFRVFIAPDVKLFVSTRRSLTIQHEMPCFVAQAPNSIASFQFFVLVIQCTSNLFSKKEEKWKLRCGPVWRATNPAFDATAAV
jgi:hypothetical protein